MTFLNLKWFFLFAGVCELGYNTVHPAYLQMKCSQWVHVEGIWSAARKQSHGNFSLHLKHFFFTDSEGENSDSFPPYHVLLWDLRNSDSTFYRPSVAHAGAKLDTRGHRSVTNFALGPFSKCKFLSTEVRKQALMEHFCNAYLSEYFRSGWNHKTLLTFFVLP